MHTNTLLERCVHRSTAEIASTASSYITIKIVRRTGKVVLYPGGLNTYKKHIPYTGMHHIHSRVLRW